MTNTPKKDPQQKQEAQEVTAAPGVNLDQQEQEVTEIIKKLTWKSLTIEQKNLEDSETPSEVAEVSKRVGQVISSFKERIQHSEKVIAEFLNAPEYERAKKLFNDFESYLFTDEREIDLFFLTSMLEGWRDLEPFIEEEVTKLRQETGHDISLVEFVDDTKKDPETGEWIPSYFEICVNRAREAKREEMQLQGLADKEQSGLQKLESIRPRRYIMPNNPIANSLTGRISEITGEVVPIIGAGAFDLPVMNSGKPGEVTAYTIVSYDQNKGVTMTGRTFTEYDRCVMNSVISLWEAGNKVITAEMIYRAMNDNRKSEYIKPPRLASISKSLDKMRHIHVYADLSEEMRKRKITTPDGEPITEFIIDNFLMILDRVQLTAGGKKKTGYKIVQEPIMLQYSKATGQLLTVRSELLAIQETQNGKTTGATIPTTENRQTIKEYLLQRIEVMKHDRKNKHAIQSNRILFDTLYRETGTDTTQRQYTANAREYAFQVLDYWAAIGYINGYSKVNEGRKIKGIDIAL